VKSYVILGITKCKQLLWQQCSSSLWRVKWQLTSGQPSTMPSINTTNQTENTSIKYLLTYMTPHSSQLSVVSKYLYRTTDTRLIRKLTILHSPSVRAANNWRWKYGICAKCRGGWGNIVWIIYHLWGQYCTHVGLEYLTQNLATWNLWIQISNGFYAWMVWFSVSDSIVRPMHIFMTDA